MPRRKIRAKAGYKMSRNTKIILVVIVFVVAYSVTLAVQNVRTPAPGVTYNQSSDIAYLFVRASPTYNFDGSFLDFVSSSGCGPACWTFKFKFASTTEGYGDRTGQNLTTKLNLHEIEIVVRGGDIVSAVIDGVWDELNQRPVSEI